MIADLVHTLWPLIGLAVFGYLGPARGLIYTVIFGYLFLPPKHVLFDLPVLPPFGKTEVILLTAVLGCLLTGHRDLAARQAHFAERRPVVDAVLKALLALLILTPIATILTNGERTGGGTIPGLTYRDAPIMIWDGVIVATLVLLARRHLFSQGHRRELLTALVIAGLIYSLLILFEVRMSPQLNRWFYGYFQSVWVQHIRDGFRPAVFVSHGLAVGRFMFAAVLAAFALARLSSRGPMLYLPLGLYLLAVLLVSRNLGAFVIAFTLIPFAFHSGVPHPPHGLPGNRDHDPRAACHAPVRHLPDRRTGERL